jgi:hypothetical protein
MNPSSAVLIFNRLINYAVVLGFWLPLIYIAKGFLGSKTIFPSKKQLAICVGIWLLSLLTWNLLKLIAYFFGASANIY